MSRRSPATLAAAPVLALVLALGTTACGEDDEPGGTAGEAASSSETPSADAPLDQAAYIETINDAQETFVEAAGELNLANPESPADFKSSLDELSPLLGTLIEDLDVTPPEAVTDQHAAAVRSLSDYRTAIDDNSEDLLSDDQETVQTAAQTIGSASQTFATDFEAAIADINTELGTTPTP